MRTCFWYTTQSQRRLDGGLAIVLLTVLLLLFRSIGKFWVKYCRLGVMQCKCVCWHRVCGRNRGLPGACCSSALKYQISIPAIEFTRAIRAEASATSLR